MRETDFINQNKQKWAELEELLNQETKDPDKLSNLFIQITDDLSYSRTFYPHRSVRVYLNNLAQQLFYNIYINKKEGKKAFVSFWKEELPQAVYTARKELLFSLAVFIIAVLIGIVSCANDAHFIRVILGDDYVNMTLENIKKGDPMAVYKEMNGIHMFLGIALNNILVAFRMFVLGVFYLVGTVVMLMYNGIMLGAFQYFFYQKGLFLTSFLTIWLHGTLEISSLVIGAGAGITMGKGLIFPGTFSRLQSLILSARRGFKILCGLVPVFLLAAFIESFMTRFTEMPAVIKLILILFSLLFILGYFVWYPFMKSRLGFKVPLKEAKLSATPDNHINIDNIKNNGELFKDIFAFYRKSFYRLIRPLFLISIVATVFTGTYHYLTSDIRYHDNNWIFAFQLFNYYRYPLLGIINTLTIAANICFVLIELMKQLNDSRFNKKNKTGFYILSFLKIFVITLLFSLILLWNQVVLATLILLILMPFFLMWMFIGFYLRTDLFKSLGTAITVVNKSARKIAGLFIVTLLLCLIIFFMFDSPLSYLYFQIVSQNLYGDVNTIKEIILILMIFTSYFVINMVIPILVVSTGLLYFSLIEMKYALSLREKIKAMANR